MDISQFGKGVIPTPDILKEVQFRVGLGASSIEWTKPYTVPAVLHQRDQKRSSSCTSQATGYYTEVLSQIENNKDEKYSNRFVYSQSYLPGGGAYIWKAMSIPLKIGAASAESVPDGDSSEETMTDQSLNGQAVLESRADKYAQIPRGSIDQLAQIVLDYEGFITGFNGHDNMFAPDGTVKDWSKTDWAHAVYVCGFEIRNGVKCLKFKNSWTDKWGDGGFGYFPEAFVNSGMMFDAYVYADLTDIENIMSEQEVRQLQALEGYSDPAGVQYWTGKLLADYLKARLEDKIKTIQEVQ